MEGEVSLLNRCGLGVGNFHPLSPLGLTQCSVLFDHFLQGKQVMVLPQIDLETQLQNSPSV